ncbi:hypothetical protein [Paraburkholderia fungorum]|uniref:hypothetical protein n=1 Tax=Paraburkholderia fungorum TaxID=134537 RepID=UPI0038B87D84
MKTLVLKDLPRVDDLDRAASRSVRGGIAYVTREAPSCCPGEMKPPIVIRGGWQPCPPFHFGCGPVYTPYGHLPSHSEPKVEPY